MTGRREGTVTPWLIGLVAGETLLSVALAAAGLAAAGTPETRAERAANRHLVAELRLTDLALWSGPSYCRHPSQTDLFAPFADHPGAFEHFPAGSLVPPPAPGDAAAGRAVFSGSPLQPPVPQPEASSRGGAPARTQAFSQP